MNMSYKTTMFKPEQIYLGFQNNFFKGNHKENHFFIDIPPCEWNGLLFEQNLVNDVFDMFG